MSGFRIVNLHGILLEMVCFLRLQSARVGGNAVAEGIL